MQAIETMIDTELQEVGIKIRSSIFWDDNKLLFSTSACNIGKRWTVTFWVSNLNQINNKQRKISQTPFEKFNLIFY